ncbi:MAG: hypothetical protein ACREDM_06355 [Methylocella sp.]
MNNIGIDYETIEAFRLGGIGWIFAFFIVGATILAGRWLVSWQMRRLERKFPGYLEDGADSQGSDTSKTP